MGSVPVDASTVPLWLDEPYRARPPLDGARAVDVCVIGGGIGGIATAWHLLERGVRPLVVEARTVASGATGRNGGFFIAGVAPMYDEAVRRWGRALAARRYAATLEAQRAMLAVADEIGTRQEFRITGLLRLGVDAAEVQAVRSHHAALAADGFPGELVAEAGLPPAVRRPGRLGLLTAHDGTVHPARWVRALAAAAEALGAVIAEGTKVTGPPQADRDGVTIATRHGDVRASRVVIAVDGGLTALVPGAGAVRARRLNMLATTPEAAGRLPYPVYARDGHEYAQQLPDGTVALGGFSDLDGAAGWTDREDVSPVVQARLDRYLADELGVGAAVTHRWAGVVGYSNDPVPTCGPVPGTDGRVVALGGYNGTGHVQAWVAASIAAELVATGAAAAADLYAPVTVRVPAAEGAA